MTRTSDNYYENGQLRDGYDYENQAWVKDGKYITCGHPESMACQCYGKLHEGEDVINHKAVETHEIPLTGTMLETLQPPAQCKCPWSMQAGCQWSKGDGVPNSKTQLSTCWNKEECSYKV